MPDLPISGLPEMVPGVLQNIDELAIADNSASETKRIQVEELLTTGLNALPPQSIDGGMLQLPLPADSVDTNAIQDGAVTDDKIADGIDGSKITDGTITDAELADGSVGTDELQDNSVTDAKIVDVDGSKIIDNSIPSGKFEPGAIESADIGQNQITGGPDGNIALNTITDDNIDEISGDVIENNSIGSDALADGAVGSAQLADDSVLNQHVAAGQISGAAGSKAHIEPNSLGSADYGLNSVNTDALALGSVTNEILANNSVTNEKVVDATLAPGKIQNTTGPAQFIAGPTGAAGVVTAREIVGDDLPTATDTEKGGVIAGDGLVMDGDTIEIDNDVAASTDFRLVTYNEKGLVTDGLINNVTGATHSVITYNDSGLVTDGRDLTADDLPEIPIDIIVGEIGDGTGDGPSLGQCAVNGPNICDYATCLIQEANPGRGDFLGQFWYTPSTAQLRVYARGSGPEDIWLPVGFGALQANNLRWAGTYDADTDMIVSLTAIGVAEGLVAGSPFPAPTDQLSGIYFVCQVAGANCSQPNLNNISHTSGDWALCIDAAQGWVHIDANAGGGGGGGGGAQYLNDLLDVEIGGTASPFSTAPAVPLTADQLLRYDGGTGIWRNTDIIDGGSIDA